MAQLKRYNGSSWETVGGSIAPKTTTTTSDTDTYSCNYVNTKGIYESGSNTNGKYIKYDDGTMICWYRQSISNVAVATADGSLFKSADIPLQDFPQTFIEAPAVNISFSNNSWTILGFGRSASSSAVSTTNPGSVFIYRATSTGTGVVGLFAHIIAIGRWK